MYMQWFAYEFLINSYYEWVATLGVDHTDRF